MTDITTHSVQVRTLPPPAGTPDTVAETARRTVDLGIGAATLASRALASTLDRFWSGPAPDRTHPSTTRRLARAATGAALVTQARLLDAANAVETVAHDTATAARRIPLVREVLVSLDASIDRWADRGTLETSRREEAAVDFMVQLVPAFAEAVLHRIDLGGLITRLDLGAVLQEVDLDALLDAVDLNVILARVDLNRLLGTVDLNGLLGTVDLNTLLTQVDLNPLLRNVDLDTLLENVDLNSLLTKVDLNALLTQVDLNALLAGVDLNALLADVDIQALLGGVDVQDIIDRVDIDGIVGRVDLEALMSRMNLGPLVNDVLDEVDIGGIVRDSTGSITSDTMDSARVGAMRLDAFVARVADRILLRNARGTERQEPPLPPQFEEHHR